MSFLKKHKWILLAWMGLVAVSWKLKLGLLVGSEHASLSLLIATVPTIAYFFPGFLALPITAVAWTATHLAWPFPITLGIPTFFATLSWRASEKEGIMDKALHIGVPALCMFLFWLTPGGGEGWLYALYWTIPMALCFISLGITGRALKSTFLAHAIGSVIWAYLVPLSGSAWIALIPVVAVERFFTASWSIVVVGLLHYVQEGLGVGLTDDRIAPAIPYPSKNAVPHEK